MKKFKITKLEAKTGEKNGKKWTLYKFTNAHDNYSYSAFSQAGYTDKFTEGYEFEAEATEKPNPKGGVYRNIQWPRVQRGEPAPYQPSSLQLTDAIKIQMDRIEKKIDKLLGDSANWKEPSEQKKIDIIGELPYQDSPSPTDDDVPF